MIFSEEAPLRRNLFFAAFDWDVCSLHVERLRRSSGLSGIRKCPWFLSGINKNNDHNLGTGWGTSTVVVTHAEVRLW